MQDARFVLTRLPDDMRHSTASLGFSIIFFQVKKWGHVVQDKSSFLKWDFPKRTMSVILWFRFWSLPVYCIKADTVRSATQDNGFSTSRSSRSCILLACQ